MNESTSPANSAVPRPGVTAVRFHDSLLAAHERKLLVAIARHLPRSVLPDHLTVFGVFGALVVIAGYGLSAGDAMWLWLANLGLVFHWLGDSLDGTVARFRHIERPRYGFYLDQVIDTIGNILIALGVGLAPWIRMDLVLIVLALYQMLSIQVYVRALVDHEFHLAVGRLGPTEMRLGIFVMNCLVLAWGEPRLLFKAFAVTWADLLVLMLSVTLFILFAIQMRTHLRRFAAEDPTPSDAGT